MYTVELADGTQLENLTLNGNNFIAEGIIESSVFQDNLSTVVITGGETAETYHDMVLIQNEPHDGRSWFILGETSPQDKALAAVRKMIESNADSITDVQVALAEIYEMMQGGM